LPAYDYFCHDCENQFEVRLSYTEADTTEVKCPQCNSIQTQRLIGQVLLKASPSKNRLTSDQMMQAAGFARAAGGPNLDGSSSGDGGHAHEHSHDHSGHSHD